MLRSSVFKQAYKMRLLFSLLFCVGYAYGFQWVTVSDSNSFPEGMVQHVSYDNGNQGVCRMVNWASGRVNSNVCRIPSGNRDNHENLPYQVLVMDPMIEYAYWRTDLVTAEQIKQHGVEVKPPHSPEPFMYVCATSSWGPGKIVIWADNDIICYIAHGGSEHRVTSGYQLLTEGNANEYFLYEMTYLLDDVNVIGEQPRALAQASLRNDDVVEHEMSYEMSYSKTFTDTWENSYGFTHGTSMSVKAGIPLFFDGEWSTSLEQDWSYNYGESHSETIETTMTVVMNVPAKHTCTVRMVSTEMIIDVPYYGTVTSYFDDGTSHTDYLSGVYDGVNYVNDHLEIVGCEPH